MNKKIILFAIVILLVLTFASFFNSYFGISGNIQRGFFSDSQNQNFSLLTVVEVPYSYGIVEQDSELLTNIKVFKIGGSNRVDLNLETFIIGPENITLKKSTETFAIETQTGIGKSIHIPHNSPPGIYEIVANVNYNQLINSSASAEFRVTEIKDSSLFRLSFIVLSILITLIILVSVLILILYKKPKPVQ